MVTVPSAADPIASAVARFEKPLMRYAVRIVGDRERAREVVQDTFVRLCEARREDLEGKLASWLFTVCRNRAIDVLRKDKHLTPMYEPPDIAVPPVGEDSRALSEIVAAIDKLPEGQRELLRLRYQQGHGYRTISQLTGMSEGNVGYQLHHAIRSLRVLLAVALTVVLVVGWALLRPDPKLPTLQRIRLQAPQLPKVERVAPSAEPPPAPAPSSTPPGPTPAPPPSRPAPPPRPKPAPRPTPPGPIPNAF